MGNNDNDGECMPTVGNNDGECILLKVRGLFVLSSNCLFLSI